MKRFEVRFREKKNWKSQAAVWETNLLSFVIFEMELLWFDVQRILDISEDPDNVILMSKNPRIIR